MYGNGRPRPIASGVSAGKMLLSKIRSSSARSSASACRGEMTLIPCSASAGRRSSSKQRVRRVALADDELADRVDLLGRAHAVGCANVQAGLELIVEIRDPDHVELVEVRLPDRAELDALHERNRRVLGELQDPVVEVEPGELAIEVEGRVLEVEGAWRPLRRYRFDGLSSG